MRLVRYSYLLSVLALALLVVLLCSNGKTEPWPAIAPLRVAVLTSSALAGFAAFTGVFAMLFPGD